MTDGSPMKGKNMDQGEGFTKIETLPNAIKSDPIQKCAATRKQLSLGIDIKLTEAEAKKKGIQIFRAQAHEKLEGKVFVDFTETESNLNPKIVEEPTKAKMVAKQGDPIEMMMRYREELKLGEEKIS